MDSRSCLSNPASAQNLRPTSLRLGLACSWSFYWKVSLEFGDGRSTRSTCHVRTRKSLDLWDCPCHGAATDNGLTHGIGCKDTHRASGHPHCAVGPIGRPLAWSEPPTIQTSRPRLRLDRTARADAAVLVTLVPCRRKCCVLSKYTLHAHKGTHVATTSSVLDRSGVSVNSATRWSRNNGVPLCSEFPGLRGEATVERPLDILVSSSVLPGWPPAMQGGARRWENVGRTDPMDRW